MRPLIGAIGGTLLLMNPSPATGSVFKHVALNTIIAHGLMTRTLRGSTRTIREIRLFEPFVIGSCFS